MQMLLGIFAECGLGLIAVIGPERKFGCRRKCQDCAHLAAYRTIAGNRLAKVGLDLVANLAAMASAGVRRRFRHHEPHLLGSDLSGRVVLTRPRGLCAVAERG